VYRQSKVFYVCVLFVFKAVVSAVLTIHLKVREKANCSKSKMSMGAKQLQNPAVKNRASLCTNEGT
jgi:hypothetical protein